MQQTPAAAVAGGTQQRADSPLLRIPTQEPADAMVQLT